jgi:hypothetical protein
MQKVLLLRSAKRLTASRLAAKSGSRLRAVHGLRRWLGVPDSCLPGAGAMGITFCHADHHFI